MFECPIDYFIDNLVFSSDKSCWGIYELAGYSYDMLSENKQHGILRDLIRFLSNTPSEAKIMIIPIKQDLGKNFDTLMEGLNPNDPLYARACHMVSEHREHLEEFEDYSDDHRTFVAFKLQRGDEIDLTITRIKDLFKFFIGTVKNGIDNFLYADTKDIPLYKIDDFQRENRKIHEEQNLYLPIEPTKTSTTQWILRRCVYRGLEKEVKLYKQAQKDWSPPTKTISFGPDQEYLRADQKALVNLFNGVISRRARTLRIEHERETSYQSFLTITNIPDLDFPGQEWIYMLQQMNLQAEICIHIRTIAFDRSMKKIENQRRRVKSQLKNIENAKADPPTELVEAAEEIEMFEAELRSGGSRLPMLESSIVVCLADENADNLNKKVNVVQKTLEGLSFIVQQPLTDQFKLFLQCLPSTGITINDFVQRLTPMAVAGGLIGASNNLGDDNGFYIGKTGLNLEALEQGVGKNVLLNLSLACLNDISAAAAFYGNLGFGKSFNANLLVYLHVMLQGAYGLIIDPKGERSHWQEEMKALDKYLSSITLSADPEFKGMLDPFNVFRDNLSEASELAINVISEFFEIGQKDNEYIVLVEATKRIKTYKKPSMESLTEILENFHQKDELKQTATMLARRIRTLSDAGMAQLLFGNGSEKAIQLSNRMNIIHVQNLRLPTPETPKEQYNPEERTSSVLMMVLAAFARRFMHTRPNNFKIVLLDESWVFSKTTQGERLITESARLGRSLYAAVLLNGHSVLDLPNEAVRNAITYKFFFRTENKNEAERMLTFMNLEITDANIELIMSLKKAQCLFQDRQGRVGILQFDVVFSDLAEIFSTTPEDVATLDIKEDKKELAS